VCSRTTTVNAEPCSPTTWESGGCPKGLPKGDVSDDRRGTLAIDGLASPRLVATIVRAEISSFQSTCYTYCTAAILKPVDKVLSHMQGENMKTMRPIGRGAELGLLLIVALIGIIIGAFGGYMNGYASSGPRITGPVHIYLATAFDPYTGLDKYLPANFTIPAGVDVLFTITNYDNGTNMVDPAYANVQGTVGGTATVNGQMVTSIPADGVTHTFTIHSLNINVPIAAAQGQTPAVVSFTLHIDQSGTYRWDCMAPCDPDAMGTPGFMTGSMGVA